MANFEIDEEVLVAFLKGELDAAQAAAVEAWYDRSAANRRMLGQVYYILYVSDRINDAAGIDVERSLRQFKRRMHAGRRISLRRIAVRAAAAAAARSDCFQSAVYCARRNGNTLRAGPLGTGNGPARRRGWA